VEGTSTTKITPVDAQLQRAAITGRSKIERETSLWERVQAAVHFVPDQGTVGRGDQTQIELRFNPTQTLSLQSLVATITITNGPAYYFNISGGGYRPVMKFDWTDHDFGRCFVVSGASPSAGQNFQKLPTAQLTVTNDQAFDVRFVCIFFLRNYYFYFCFLFVVMSLFS
jgi:hypothetical protein